MNEVSFTILQKGDQYFFQHRDDKPGISSPNLFAGFGGAIELDETPIQAAKRELAEETSLNVSKLEFKLLGKIDLTDRGLGIRYAYIANITDEDFEVYEGQGKVHFSIKQLKRIDLNKFTPSNREAIKILLRNQAAPS